MSSTCRECGKQHCLGHRPTASGSVGPPTQLSRERQLMGEVAQLKARQKLLVKHRETADERAAALEGANKRLKARVAELEETKT